MQSVLDQALNDNNLITLRSLNGGFSELPDKANLSYSQSYSVVKFMIDTYGQQKMTDLLIALRDAKPIDQALLEVYGFDTDGLDSAWREIGRGRAAHCFYSSNCSTLPNICPNARTGSVRRWRSHPHHLLSPLPPLIIRDSHPADRLYRSPSP